MEPFVVLYPASFTEVNAISGSTSWLPRILQRARSLPISVSAKATFLVTASVRSYEHLLGFHTAAALEQQRQTRTPLHAANAFAQTIQ